MKKIRKWLTGIRYWLLIQLIGKMSVIANVEVSDYDFNSNLERSCKTPHMFFNNKVYSLDKLIRREMVNIELIDDVLRVGNSFTLVR